jgi:hypothetical protein
MARNLDLLDQVLDFVRMNPERWYQGSWFSPGSTGYSQKSIETLRDITDPERIQGENWCGTTGCIAGHAVTMFGYKPVIVFDSTDGYFEFSNQLVAQGENLRTYDNLHDNTFKTDDKAAELLGLSTHDAELLFAGSNPMDSIEHLVKSWHNGVDTDRWSNALGISNEEWHERLDNEES